jgi:hypothetical protein
MNWAVLLVNGTEPRLSRSSKRTGSQTARGTNHSEPVVPENPIGAEIIELAGLGFSGMFATLLSFLRLSVPKNRIALANVELASVRLLPFRDCAQPYTIPS